MLANSWNNVPARLHSLATASGDSFANSPKLQNQTIPNGRVFFHWFPNPHLLVLQAGNGLEDAEKIVIPQYFPKLQPYITATHLLLSLDVWPKFNPSLGLLYRNAPKWLLDSLGNPYSCMELARHAKKYPFLCSHIKFFKISEKKSDIFSLDGISLADRMQKAYEIINIWEKLNIRYFLTCENDLKTEEIDPDLQELFEEDVLAFKDEIICQILKK